MRFSPSLFLFLFAFTARAQTSVPSYYTVDNQFNRALKDIVVETHLDSVFNVGEDGTETISLAVIDLTGKKAVRGRKVFSA